jgi:dolichol-phosphate mannosyltransferase
MPLKMIAYFGFAGLLFTIVLGIQTLVRYWSGNAVEGFTTVILLILLTSSMIMISLGIIGLYLARMYEEIKQRPRYIIHHHLKGKKESCETNVGLDEQA